MEIEISGKIVTLNLALEKTAQPKVQGTDFAALLKEQKEIKAEILDKGFGTYVADMQQEKLEKEIREKILNALGISEEEYAQLPASQRAAIEAAVQASVREEMVARMGQKNEEEDEQKKSGLSVPLVAGLSMGN